jgi:hypothetical protein
MENSIKTSLKRAVTPEEAGVLSFEIAAFIDDLKESNIETHSIMILRHGVVAFETWAEPYGPDLPHAMFSVSKSFTSTAVGFAVEEGLLSLETRILDLFPEYKPEEPDENIEKLTIYHLLTMTAGKDATILADKTKDHWVRDFFEAKWKFAPGESFKYVNENIYMLCAALVRVTGMPVIDYLTPRLFEPLGFGRIPFWEADPGGIEAGGWGLFVTTEELAKISLCYLQGGVFNGKQVIPEKWAREATRKQVETNRKTADSSVGYGFCFWRNSCPDTYRLDGMFSQFGIVFEKYDAVVVITACEIQEQKYRDCIWRHFPEAFFDESAGLPDNDVPHENPHLEPLKDLAAAPRSPYEKIIAGRTMKTQRKRLLEAANFPLSMLPIAILYMSADKAGNIEGIEFEFGENECRISWTEGDERNSVLCGMDGKPRLSKIRLASMDFTASCTAAWKAEKTLSFWMRPLESISQRQVDFVFNGFDVEMYFSSSPSTRKMLMTLSRNVEEYVKNALAVKAVREIMLNAHKFVEPAIKGRLYPKTGDTTEK